MQINILNGFKMATLLLFLNSCIRKEDFNQYNAPDTWEGAFAAPLAESDVTLGQIINKNLKGVGILPESDSSYYYIVDNLPPLESPTAESLIQLQDPSIPPQTINFKVPQPQNFSIPGINITNLIDANDLDQFISFDVSSIADSISFDYILLKGGLFDFNVTTTLQHNVYYTITCNSMIDPIGNPFVYKGLIIPGGGISSNPIDMSGYKLNLSNKGLPDSKFSAQIKIDSIISTSAGINENENLSFGVSITGLKFKRIVGQFKSLNIATGGGSFGQTIDLPAMDNSLFSNILLADPQISLKFENSFGIKFDANLGDISSIDKNGKPHSLLLSNPIVNINNPTIFGETDSTNFFINQSNSNLSKFLFDSTATKLVFNPTVSIDNSLKTMFIEDNSKIKAYVKIKLPAYGQIKKLEIKDTIYYTFPENLNAETVTLKTKITNGTSLNVKVQLYLLDSNKVQFDSVYYYDSNLENGNIIDAAKGVDNNGKASSPTTKIVAITRDKEWYDRVKNKTWYFKLVGKVYTPAGENVKFFSDQKISLKVALKVGGYYQNK